MAQLDSLWRGFEPERLDALLFLLESSKVVGVKEMRDVLPRLPSENLIPTWVPPFYRIRQIIPFTVDPENHRRLLNARPQQWLNGEQGASCSVCSTGEHDRGARAAVSGGRLRFVPKMNFLPCAGEDTFSPKHY
eukprot:scaffold32998_cov135-Isochrysis_galbana.AAC.1